MNIKSINNKCSYEDISCIIVDKDGTITNSHYYWSEIIQEEQKIINYFNLDFSLYDFISSSMGLDVKKNTLMPEGPIALKTRKEVIYILFNKIYKLSNLITESLLEDIFLEVHNEFKKDSYKFIKPIKDAIKFIKICKNFEINLVLISSDTESNTRQAVNILDIKQCFDLIIGGDSGFGDKTTGQLLTYMNLIYYQIK